MKPVYSMSSVGECPRALGANRLGYESLPETGDSQILLTHASRCEALAAQQLMDEGYRIEPSSQCQLCLDRYSAERYGIHVEMDTPLLLLVGHLDRRLILDNNRKLPVEIKSLGRFTWEKFAKKGFEEFTSYIGQEACYLEAEKSPGIYWVMNRDNGKSLKYIVNDFDNSINLNGFQKITLPITYNTILDKLNQVEIAAQYGELLDGEESDNCRWCRFKYLCSRPEEKKLKVEDTAPLIEAARMYKEAHEMEKQAKEIKESAVFALLSHSKENKVDKYRVGSVSFTYHGQKVRESIDAKSLKLEMPEMYEKYKRESKPYDDYSIRLIGEK